MNIVVVMPTYNEAENLPAIVSALLGLDLGPHTLRVLVVDDNSPDGTGRIADELAKRTHGQVSVLHRPGKQGLGRAYVAGIERALADGADAVLEMDADFSHHPRYVPRMVAQLEHADVVVGSRNVAGGSVDPNWPRWRKIISAGGSLYARTILGLKVHDATAGFKLFRRAVLETIPFSDVRSNGYAFQIEMAYHCQKHGFRVVEMPIRFDDRTLGSSKMSANIAIEAAWRVWQIRQRG